MNINSFSKQYDAVVAGGGIAGIAAALAAARGGANVALVEKTLQCGGLATNGIIVIYLPICDGNGKQVTFGLAAELMHGALKYGPGTIPQGWDSGKNNPENGRYMCFFAPAALSLAAEEMLIAAGVDIWYDTCFISLETHANQIEYLTVANKSGIGRLHAKVFVDASGDADLAHYANLACPVAGNALAFWTVDYSLNTETILGKNIALTTAGFSTDSEITTPGINGRTVSEFIQSGRRNYVAELKKIYATAQSRHERFPLLTPAQAPLRHTRRITGCFTLESNMNWQHFNDSIGMVADWRTANQVWEIPYRTLIVPELTNLITAGRCISAANDAWEITRVIPAAALTGEAAGCAALASCQISGGNVRDLPAAQVQKAMQQNGNILFIKDLY